MYPFSRRSDAGTLRASKGSSDAEAPERRSCFSTFELICFVSSPSCDRNTIFASRWSIHIPACVFIGSSWLRFLAITAFKSELHGVWRVRNDHFQRALVGSICKGIVGLHHVLQGEAMRDELIRLKLP